MAVYDPKSVVRAGETIFKSTLKGLKKPGKKKGRMAKRKYKKR